MAGDRAIVRDFLGTKKPPEARYAGLFRYFVEGFLAVATPGFERAQYRGMGSRQGYSISGVEGFARTAPMFAAWLASGRPAILPRKGSRAPVDLQAVLVSGLTHGADPDSNAFWGEIRSNSQLIVEAADIALTLWLGRDLAAVVALHPQGSGHLAADSRGGRNASKQLAAVWGRDRGRAVRARRPGTAPIPGL